MKIQTSSIKKVFAVLSAAVILGNFTIVSAANPQTMKFKSMTKKYAKLTDNLIEGTKSENLGLKKSSIYYIGFYKLNNAVSTLVDQLKTEKDPEVKTLIALSLYKVGDENGFNAIRSLAENDENENVRITCKEIYKACSSVLDSELAQIDK